MESLNFRSRHHYQASAIGIEIPIIISSNQRKAGFLAKVDTGATFCIFQREYAEELNIEVETGIRQVVLTATGRFETYGHTVMLSCLDFDTESMVYFAGSYDFSRNVLGLHGWLDKVRFGLVHHDNCLFMSPYDE